MLYPSSQVSLPLCEVTDHQPLTCENDYIDIFLNFMTLALAIFILLRHGHVTRDLKNVCSIRIHKELVTMQVISDKRSGRKVLKLNSNIVVVFFKHSLWPNNLY
jgi:hypothetical protein